MRWAKWGLLAAWLGFHAWLWMILPPVPRWTLSGIELNGTGLAPDGRALVTSDRSTVTVWDLANGRRLSSWPRPRPASKRLVDLNVAPVGRRAVVYDDDRECPVMIELDTGRTVTLPPLSVSSQMAANETMIRASLDFSSDGRYYVQLTRHSDSQTVAVCIKDLKTGTERDVPLKSEATNVHCAADGRTALVTLHDPAGDEWKIAVIDLISAEVRGSLDVGVVRGLQHQGVSTHQQVAAVNTFRIIRGQLVAEIQMWNLSTCRRIAVVPAELAQGWNAEGLLVTVPDNAGIRLLDAAGKEVKRWPASPHEAAHLFLTPAGGILVAWEGQPRPAWQIWVYKRLFRSPPDWEDGIIHIYDAQSGEKRGRIQGSGPFQAVHLTADGRTLAVSALGRMNVWDIPPRKPGGLVLALMIAEVALFSAWTALRRRWFRNRSVAANP